MSKDDLIRIQNQVIGILFEIVKRLQANNDLDEEYFEIIAAGGDKKRLDEIMAGRKENAEVVRRLLQQLEV